ncbi:SH3 domain-containing protein [Mycena metata]|uniref:SH3 domain-containing protein n=1 Tax=Mycena metata TaxID=1033252 RepID=A0AAD7NWV0_9AGAR|nr:SH3 domain-containing protein [Mycena metata]
MGIVPSDYLPGDDQNTSKKYRARALYNYTASTDDPNEISFQKGDILEILDTSVKWWQAKKEDGRIGIAPSNYLLIYDGDDQHTARPSSAEVSSHSPSSPRHGGSASIVSSSQDVPKYQARAIYDYTASDDDPNEISFRKGDILDIWDKDGKWWEVKKPDGAYGIVPSNFLYLLEKKEMLGIKETPIAELHTHT